jgi:hypothetical protein
MQTKDGLFLTVPLEQVGQSHGALPERPVLLAHQSEVRNVLWRRASDCGREDASECNPNTRLSATRIQDWNHEDSFAGGTHVSISRVRRVVTGVRTSVPDSYVHVRVLPSGRDSPGQQSEMRHLVTIGWRSSTA